MTSTRKRDLTPFRDLAVIIAAAGSSKRFGDAGKKKVFATLGNQPLFAYCLDAFADFDATCQVIMVIHRDDELLVLQNYSEIISMHKVEIVVGGDERWQSVRNAVAHLNSAVQFVAIHDAARPLISVGDISRTYESAKKSGAAVLAAPIFGTIKRVDAAGAIIETVPRDNMFQAQTPQIFCRDWIERAYRRTDLQQLRPTDDAQLIEAEGHSVHVVPGNQNNIKITTTEDLRWATTYLQMSRLKSNDVDEYEQGKAER